jgi:hypothetical protein
MLLKSSFLLGFLEALPEINSKLPTPKKAFDRANAINNAKASVVMVLSY